MLTNGRLRTSASWNGDFPAPSALPCLSLLFLNQLVVTEASPCPGSGLPVEHVQNKTGKSWLWGTDQVPGPCPLQNAFVVCLFHGQHFPRAHLPSPLMDMGKHWHQWGRTCLPLQES